jgi:copper transport protein
VINWRISTSLIINIDILVKLVRMKDILKKKGSNFLLFFIMLVMALVLDTRTVSAYAILLRSEPADGSVLGSAPPSMKFWFSEAILSDKAVFTLQDADNHQWSLKPYLDPKDSTVVVVDLPALTPNAYHLSWSVTTSSDLHASNGTIVFGIQQAVSRAPAPPIGVPTFFSEVILHWIGLLSFAAVLGALMIVYFLLPKTGGVILSQPPSIEKYTISFHGNFVALAFWCSGIALISGFLELWIKSLEVWRLCSHQGLLIYKLMLWGNSIVATSSASLLQGVNQQILDSVLFVEGGLVREICLLLLMVFILVTLRRSRIRGSTQFGGIRSLTLFISLFTLLYIFLSAFLNQLRSFTVLSPARLIVYSLHFIGSGCWIGGLIMVIALRATPNLSMSSEGKRSMYGKTTGLIAIGLVILTISGLFFAGQQVASVDAFLLTVYGRVLIGKIALALWLAWFGLSRLYQNNPLSSVVFPRSISKWMDAFLTGKANPRVALRWEWAVCIVIIFLAAWLGSTQPANGSEFDPPLAQPAIKDIQSLPSSKLVDDLLINFSVRPNHPGQNFLSVGVFNTRRPSPAPIEQVVVKMVQPDGQDGPQIILPPVETEGQQTYQLTTSVLDISGSWKISVIVHRKGMEDSILEIPWMVTSAIPITYHRPTFVSNRPLASIFAGAAILLVGTLGIIWLFVLLRSKSIFQTDDKSKNLGQPQV